MSDPLSPEYHDTEVSHAEAAPECPHENTTYDPGNYIPPFGWEQRPGMFCDDCGEEIEPEYDDVEPEYDDGYYDVTPDPEELREEARNPL